MRFRSGLKILVLQVFRRWRRLLVLSPRLVMTIILFLFYSIFRIKGKGRIRGRCSQSVGNFKKKVLEIWELPEYKWWEVGKSTLFFGVFSLLDYFDVLFHTGEVSVFWVGSDILGLIRAPLLRKIFRLKKAAHWCEDEVEKNLLKLMGIEARICISFLEDIKNFPVSYKHSMTPQVWLSAHPDREEEYGLKLVQKISPAVPEIKFHIFGVKGLSPYPNIIYHGQVANEEFNKMIVDYQAGIRLNEIDGASEVMMKSILMGQYPITRIKFPMVDSFNTEKQLIHLLKSLKYKKQPNFSARTFYIKQKLNQRPF